MYYQPYCTRNKIKEIERKEREKEKYGKIIYIGGKVRENRTRKERKGEIYAGKCKKK